MSVNMPSSQLLYLKLLNECGQCYLIPSIPVRALPTRLCHSRNSSAWRRERARTSPHQREANLANIRAVGWVMVNNTEELGKNAAHLTQISAFQTKWWAGMCLLRHQQLCTEGGTGGHSLGVLLQDPFHEVLCIFTQVNNIRNGPWNFPVLDI